jgi:hypothetical protein
MLGKPPTSGAEKFGVGILMFVVGGLILAATIFFYVVLFIGMFCFVVMFSVLRPKDAFKCLIVSLVVAIVVGIYMLLYGNHEPFSSEYWSGLFAATSFISLGACVFGVNPELRDGRTIQAYFQGAEPPQYQDPVWQQAPSQPEPQRAERTSPPPPLDDEDFAFDPSAFKSMSDDALWTAAADPNRTEGERKTARRLIEKRAQRLALPKPD